MARYTSSFVTPGGFKVLSGTPIDDRLLYNVIDDFQAMLDGLDASEPPTIYDGARITFMYDVDNPLIPRQADFLWKESGFGALTVGYTYTYKYGIGGITYKDKTYNLVPAAEIAKIDITLAVDSTIIKVPLGKVPFKLISENIFSVVIKEGSDKETVLPDGVKLNLANKTLDVYVIPAYPAGTVLTLKIS